MNKFFASNWTRGIGALLIIIALAFLCYFAVITPIQQGVNEAPATTAPASPTYDPKNGYATITAQVATLDSYKAQLTGTPQVFTVTPIILTPTLLPTAIDQVVSGEYLVPGDFAMLPNKNGVSYSVATEGPFDVYSSYGQTIIIAVGNLTVDGKYVYVTDKKGTVGNLHVFICNEKSGCKNTLTDYKAGHVRVTIVDGDTEVPNESVAWAVNFMLTGGGNCGNKCLTVFVGYIDEVKDEFTSSIEPSAIRLIEVALRILCISQKLKGQYQMAQVFCPARKVRLVIHFIFRNRLRLLRSRKPAELSFSVQLSAQMLMVRHTPPTQQSFLSARQTVRHLLT